MNNYVDYVLNRHDTDSEKSLLSEAGLGLGSEAGEVQQCIRKYIYEDRPLNIGELLLELGDTIHYLSLIIAELQNHCYVNENIVKAVNKAKLYAKDRGFNKYFEEYLLNVDFDRENTDILQIVDAVISEINEMIEFGNNKPRG